LDTIESILHAAVNSIETVANTISNTAKLAIYILVIETFKQIGTSDGTLDSSIADATITKQTAVAQNGKPY
jgi:hypothetical protein